MNLILDTLLYKSIIAAVEAGKEILEVYDTDFNVQYKEDKTPLTLADQRASQKIIDLLADTNIPVLSEEGEQFTFEKREPLEYIWIVDPLDGTKEFVKRNGEFTVNIALVHNGKPVIGVIYSPVFKDIYFAAKGLGSFKIGKHDFIGMIDNLNFLSLDRLLLIAKKLPITSYPQIYTVVASRSHLSKETNEYIAELKQKHKEVTIVNTGSSIKMCWVAEGLANEYPRFGPTMEWDTAAGQTILENANCELIDFDTKKAMQYNRAKLLNNWFTAKNKD